MVSRGSTAPASAPTNATADVAAASYVDNIDFPNGSYHSVVLTLYDVLHRSGSGAAERGIEDREGGGDSGGGESPGTAALATDATPMTDEDTDSRTAGSVENSDLESQVVQSSDLLCLK